MFGTCSGTKITPTFGRTTNGVALEASSKSTMSSILYMMEQFGTARK
jgi:hypothetical protein